MVTLGHEAIFDPPQSFWQKLWATLGRSVCWPPTWRNTVGDRRLLFACSIWSHLSMQIEKSNLQGPLQVFRHLKILHHKKMICFTVFFKTLAVCLFNPRLRPARLQNVQELLMEGPGNPVQLLWSCLRIGGSWLSSTTMTSPSLEPPCHQDDAWTCMLGDCGIRTEDS